MILCGSLLNQENHNVYDGTPNQGVSEVRRAGVVLNGLFLIRRGRGGNHRKFMSNKKISYHT